MANTITVTKVILLGTKIQAINEQLLLLGELE